MAYKPIIQLPDSILKEKSCAVCGSSSLKVMHVSGFPDFIECLECGSACIMAEDLEHVLFGKISPSYPETREMALKQWILEDALREAAELERPIAHAAPPESSGLSEPARNAGHRGQEELTPAPPEDRDLNGLSAEASTQAPTEAELTVPPAVSTPSAHEKVDPDLKPGSRLSALWKEAPMPGPVGLVPPDAQINETPGEPHQAQNIPEEQGSRARTAAQPNLERAPVFLPNATDQRTLEDLNPESDDWKLDESKPPASPLAYEPEQGIRFRVVLSGSQIKFPYKVCSHCLNSPASSSLSLTIFLPDTEEPSQRVPTQVRIPLCTSCRNRASAHSSSEKQARKRAFLYASGSSLLLILALIVTGVLKNTAESNSLVSLFLILITATLGFSIPLLILLEQAGRIAPPEDALFILSTLYMPPSPQQDLTIFDWRSRGYAELFHLANRASTVKSVHEVEDQRPALATAANEPDSEETGSDL